MRFRSTVVALVLALGLVMPANARAEESPPLVDAPFAVQTIAMPLVRPLGARLDLLGTQPMPPRLALFAPTPAEIRMSRGTKAVIIVAIVVGALLVVGAVVLVPKHF